MAVRAAAGHCWLVVGWPVLAKILRVTVPIIRLMNLTSQWKITMFYGEALGNSIEMLVPVGHGEPSIMDDKPTMMRDVPSDR